MNELGIVAALAVELRPLRPTTTRMGSLATLGDGSLGMVSGMGRVAAAAAARRLIEAGAGALMSWGLAGGLDPALAAGRIVLPDEVIAPEGAVLATSRPWREQLQEAIAASQPVCGGRLLTYKEVIGTPEEKLSAWRRTGAVAVDMESHAIAEIAAQHRLPFLAVRVVVDSADDALPPVAVAAVAEPGLGNIARLLGALARSPGELPNCLRLMGHFRAAHRALTRVARSGALAPPGLGAAPIARPA